MSFRISNNSTKIISSINSISTDTIGYSINQLRLLNPTSIDKIFYCNENGKEGFWEYDSSDTISSDNTGTVLVCNNGAGPQRLKRIYNDFIELEWFDITSNDIDISGKLQKIIDNNYRKINSKNKIYNLSTVKLRDGTFIKGNGTFFHILGSTDAMFKTNDTSDIENITFDGITFDGNKSQLSSSFIATATPQNGSIVCTSSSYKNIKITNCIFKNSVIAALCVAGNLDIQNSSFLSPNQHGLLSGQETHCIFAQPLVDISRLNINVFNCLFKAESEDINAIKENSSGIFITQQQSAYGRYENVSIKNNKFYGTSCAHQPNVMGAIDTYNGVRRIIVDGNFFENLSFSAIKIQRTSDAIITNNQIYNITNSLDKKCFPILYEPQAREGEFPYTGSRLGEVLYNCIIKGNIIKSSTRHAIVSRGSNVLISDNIIENVVTDASGVLQVISIEKSNNDIYNNIIKNCNRNVIYLPSGTTYTEVNVIGNKYKDMDISSTGNMFIDISGLQNSLWKDNVIDCLAGSPGTGISIRNGNNVKISNNIVVNKQTSYDIKDSSIRCSFENNIVSNTGSYTPLFKTPDVTLIEERFNSWNPKITYDVNSPTTGNWIFGDIVYNTNPITLVSGGYIGWICITSGTPGVWKQFGLIL